MTITELVKKAHGNAVDKGFYPQGEDKNIGELLMLVVSEVSEALEAHRACWQGRKCLPDLFDETETDENKWKENFRACIKDSFPDELADAVIRIADMCGYLNIDLEKHIELKMKYNSMREYKHGKRY